MPPAPIPCSSRITPRDAWGFKGFVVSECAAIVDLYNGRHNAPDPRTPLPSPSRSAPTLSCGIWALGFNTLARAVCKGVVTKDYLTRSAERLYTARFKLGMFDAPGVNPNDCIPFTETASVLTSSRAGDEVVEAYVKTPQPTGPTPLPGRLRASSISSPETPRPNRRPNSPVRKRSPCRNNTRFR